MERSVVVVGGGQADIETASAELRAGRRCRQQNPKNHDTCADA
jgi:hypothetical protein